MQFKAELSHFWKLDAIKKDIKIIGGQKSNEKINTFTYLRMLKVKVSVKKIIKQISEVTETQLEAYKNIL